MPLAPEEEAKQLLRAAQRDVGRRPASDLVEAVKERDQKRVLIQMAALGIPTGSPLGQSLLRLAG